MTGEAIPNRSNELAQKWLDYMARGGDAEQDPKGNQVWCEVGDLGNSDPVAAWKIIKTMLDDPLGVKLSGHIAAGPFEDLLSGLSEPLSTFFQEDDARYLRILLPHTWFQTLPADKRDWLAAMRTRLTSFSE